MEKKKRPRFLEKRQDEDKISSLSDDLIHKILSFVDAKLAVQTSVLSKRWKLVWTTLPYVNLTNYKFSAFNNVRDRMAFFYKFFLWRNCQSIILKVNIAFDCSVELFISECIYFAILNNARELNYEFSESGFNLSASVLSYLRSTWLRKLALRPIRGQLLETNCWNLPALTTLHLAAHHHYTIMLPESYLVCLPCLDTLVLEGFQLPDSISLPRLTTLDLTDCLLPLNIWDFPALLTLKLDSAVFPESHRFSQFFPALVSLKNLILVFRTNISEDFLINCPQLVNLEINASVDTTFNHSHKIIVLAPNIRNFTSVGFFPIMFGVSELENVNIKLQDSNGDKSVALREELKFYYTRVIYMFPGLSSAKILTLNSETLEALSAVSKVLVLFPSPFYQLKYVKVPRGHKESSVSADLKRYLLGRSPKATIVDTLPWDRLTPLVLPVCLSSQRLLPGKPLATPFAEPGNDRASSSTASDEIGLWKGHEISSEFLSLLDCIEKTYPETFDYFTTNSKKLCSMKLNMLCTIVKNFTRTSMTEVDIEMIAEYRAQFAELQRSFNVKWLVKRLNFIEQLLFSSSLLDKLDAVDSRIDSAKRNLHDLQALRMRMLTGFHTGVGTMDSSLGVGYIGDDLFSGP